MQKEKIAPLFEHDCEDSVFLGYCLVDDKHRYDLYHCKGRVENTVIARFGEYGDYFSGLAFAYEGPLKKALHIAMAKGLISDEDIDGFYKGSWEFAKKCHKRDGIELCPDSAMKTFIAH